jgi:hypothetical protein
VKKPPPNVARSTGLLVPLLIVGVFGALLFLVGGGMAVWWLKIRSTAPAVVAVDAQQVRAMDVTVYLIGDARPLATLKDVELPASNEAWTRNDFTQDKRVLFAPEGKLIAIIPKSNDRLVLHRFDVEEAMDKAGIDYLFVVSRPPSALYKGTQFAYAPQVKSKKGGVKFKLESGPDGMKPTAEGKLTWDVPKDFAEAEVDVILTVGDGSGQEVFHTFKITVRNNPDTRP